MRVLDLADRIPRRRSPLAWHRPAFFCMLSLQQPNFGPFFQTGKIKPI